MVVSSKPASQIGAASFGDKVAHAWRAFLSWILVMEGKNKVCPKESVFYINMACRREQRGIAWGVLVCEGNISR